MGTASGFSRRTVGPAVAIIALVIASACEPPRSETLTNGYRTSIITRDHENRYTVGRPAADAVTVHAPTSNRGGNLRMAIVDDTAPISIDQEACATWHGPVGGVIQPGLVLRARTDSSRTQLLMITNNVWGHYRPTVNVHLIDSVRWPEAFQSLGGGQFNSIGRSDGTHPLPWRFCARVLGDRLSVKAWSTVLAEPNWDGPENVFHLTVPPEFVYAGQAGVYAGHVEPGQQTRYSAVETTAIAGGPGEERWHSLLQWAAHLKGRVEDPHGALSVPFDDPAVARLAMRASLREESVAAAEAAATPTARTVTGRHVFTRMLGRVGGGAIGVSAADRAAQLTASKEFNQGITNDAQWVTRLYERVLGRAPTVGQRATWVDRIKKGSRREVAAAFWRSNSHTDRLAVELFQLLHGRAPSAAERQRAVELVRAADADAAWAMGLLVADLTP